MNTLSEVLDEWQANLNFKKNFKNNPEKALADAGLTLSPEDLTKVKAILKIQNEVLDKRINK